MNIITTCQNCISAPYLALIILLSLSIIIPIFVVGIIQGKKKCYKNDAMGVLILFIFLNIFGLMWGLAILYNCRHNVTNNEKNENDDENIITVKPKTNIPPQSN
ncbi:hypothetical protein [Spiroplasma endosymbiont of Virgichneumon dumeticola]|uniref:hypothetical protein n=1 Tax=Spiroplasma endosymbiont of Virgichneumon dumeticola TaxID=3139323 RepID=UPI0035C930EE